jgi:hypothetical protein
MVDMKEKSEAEKRRELRRARAEGRTLPVEPADEEPVAPDEAPAEEQEDDEKPGASEE